MRPLRSGQETILAWQTGAVECRVVAAAGAYVLLHPDRHLDPYCAPAGRASLTYLEGLVPMGWDGEVSAGTEPGELRFRVAGDDTAADRRTSVRVPIFGAVRFTGPGGQVHDGQLLDVSAGGLRFRHSAYVAPGQVLRVTADLPDGILIDADAVVRASEIGVAAVEFTRMLATDRETVGRWTVSVLRASLGGRG